jgi:Tfp pilus assembly protein PilV
MWAVSKNGGLRTSGHKRRARSSRGLSLLEVTIAMSVIMTILLASAGAFGSSISTVNSARRTSRASLFLETVMEDVSAQSYANLLAFNGNHVYDHATASVSEFQVALTVTQAAVGMRRVDAVVTDLRNSREIGHVVTLRAER